MKACLADWNEMRLYHQLSCYLGGVRRSNLGSSKQSRILGGVQAASFLAIHRHRSFHKGLNTSDVVRDGNFSLTSYMQDPRISPSRVNIGIRRDASKMRYWAKSVYVVFSCRIVFTSWQAYAPNSRFWTRACRADHRHWLMRVLVRRKLVK